ncbi:MAG: Eco57I restriction-modification methylase domain-containing protein [Prevotella sp.]|nr:Eco57I restriction-modification methylase domain-containing protein [Prevotella sp.]
MKEVLKSFSQKSLYDACCDMLNSLQISFKPVTRQALLFNNLYHYELSKSLSEVVDKVEATYYIGNIDEATLSGKGEAKSIDEVEKATSESKYESMMVFAVDITEGKQLSRSQCATLTRGFNRIAAAQPVILFVREGDKLTLSTCERMEYSQEWRRGAGEKLGKVSMLKGIDCLHPHRGHIDILNSLGDKRYPSFDELYKHWMEVFSAQPLTKGFYRDLFEWYQWAVAPETKVSFPGDVSTQDDDREDIDTRVIRLITRLMFVWFIKQKGLVPNSIFDVNYLGSILKDFDPQSATDTNYYQAILQNLFFGTLNRAIIEDGERREFAKAAKSDVKNLYRYEELFSISEDEVIELFSSVPFLNCGLFECQDKSKTLDGVERRFYNDGFSRNALRWKDGTYKYRATVPNILFFHPEKGLVSIFNRYEFTIEENTPQDVQVALDPELLGKVFENLLGAYNPETKETARNQSGSFYTPREIVQYMVNESLVAHLKRTVDDKLEDKFRQLLDFTTHEVELTDEQKHQIVHALFTCKILDPACGSGAFPMGMLQQMVHILRQVDPKNEQWREVLLDMASDDSRRAFGIADEEERNKKLDEIKETFNNALNSPDYTRKLYIIESCIYGVDIQPIAMLITRLRFFITLICEQNEIMLDKPEDNFGIKTLPNLESKFVAANSLISADIHKYNNDWTQDSVLAILKDELMAIRRRHFYTRKRSEKIRLLRDDEKKREQIHEHINKLVGEPNEKRIAELQHTIKEKETELAKYQGERWIEESVQTDMFSDPQIIRYDANKRFRDIINATITNCRNDIMREKQKSIPSGFEAAVLQVTDWNPYDQNTVSPFLDIEWMFGVREGFDIVIGNPPYRRIQGIRSDNSEYADYLSRNYKAATGSFDLYVCFAERAMNLCNNDGFVNFIMPIKWSNGAMGKGLRLLCSENKAAQRIINFGSYQVFNASTYTALQWFKKDSDVLLYNELDRDLPSNKDLSSYLEELTKSDFSEIPSDKLNAETWVLTPKETNEILNRLKCQHYSMGDYFDKIFCGLQTSRDDTYFLHDCTTCGKYIRGFSKDQGKYYEIEKGLVHPLLKGNSVHRYENIKTDKYVIFPYKIVDSQAILYTEDEIRQQFPLGYAYLLNSQNILRKRENGKLINDALWYRYIYPKSLSLFGKEKLVAPYTSFKSQFSYDINGDFYATTKIYGYIKKDMIKSSYKSLMAILNSSLMWFFIKNTGYVLRGGYYTYTTNYVKPFPMPSDEAIIAIEPVLIPLVDKVLLAKKNNPKADTSTEEREIDNIVFDLYGLTEEERNEIIKES